MGLGIRAEPCTSYIPHWSCAIGVTTSMPRGLVFLDGMGDRAAGNCGTRRLCGASASELSPACPTRLSCGDMHESYLSDATAGMVTTTFSRTRICSLSHLA